LRQRGIAALSLAALSLIGLALGLGNLHRGIYVAVLTMIFALTAIWLGATAVRQARRGGTLRPRGAVSGIVLGCFGLAQLNAYFNCLASANTVTAQQACHSQFTNSVSSEIGLLQNGK
jgi:hypothetical protein